MVNSLGKSLTTDAVALVRAIATLISLATERKVRICIRTDQRRSSSNLTALVAVSINKYLLSTKFTSCALRATKNKSMNSTLVRT